MLSHGFLPNIVKRDDLDLLNLKIKKFINKKKDTPTYFSQINKTIPCVSNLINQKILYKVEELLKTKNPSICNIELHIQPKKSEIIPPHQDNFYHCINPNQGLKILIPLQPMNSESGALTFVDCDVNFPVQRHISSRIRNFSSYIPKKNMDNLDLEKTTYKYSICDASYHFINSIHFSEGNLSSEDIYFIVFRFQIPNATINKKALAIYRECYSKHKKLIRKFN